MSTHILISLGFSGVSLPVATDTKGLHIVPLKPIADLFGLKWESQRQKVNSEWQKELLGTTLKKIGAGGVCTPDMGGADQGRDMTCIRLDRVEAYLFSINPEKVRAAGNEAAADYLKSKIKEWADLMHEFEQQNGTYSAEAAKQIDRDTRSFISLLRVKKDASDSDRKVIDALLQQKAAALGCPYQTDLIH